jgi:hypothetical protein
VPIISWLKLSVLFLVLIIIFLIGIAMTLWPKRSGQTATRKSAARPEHGIDPSLHRVAVIASGTLDSLPHNGAVVTLLAVCGTTHRESYLDIVMVGTVGAVIALAVVIALGSAFGSF